jgi:hypothetical protein
MVVNACYLLLFTFILFNPFLTKALNPGVHKHRAPRPQKLFHGSVLIFLGSQYGLCLYPSLLVPTILRRLLDFWKICAALP